MGLAAIYQRPRTSRPASAHRIYPYLLRGLRIERVHQVWAADITYIPMARGFLYLVAVMDWVSRYVLAWRLSNLLDADFCIETLEEALRQGRPEIFNTGQGSQFTGDGFTGVLRGHGVAIKADGLKSGTHPQALLQELARRAVSERLVQALVVVEFEVGGDALTRLRHVVVGLEVDLFVLEAAPQPFHEDVVGKAAAPVHEGTVMRQQRIICLGASAVRSSSQRRWSTKPQAGPAPVIRNATQGAGRRRPFSASPPWPAFFPTRRAS